MLWSDGALVAEKPHMVARGMTYTAAVNEVEPGVAQIVASIWETGTSPGAYLTASPNVAGAASPFVLPSVLSGQYIASRITRTLFNCPPSYVQADAIDAALKAAGVSALTVGVFTNPADSQAANYPTWLTSWESLVKPALDWCAANGYRIVGSGDDFMRTPSEANWLATSSFAQQAVQHVAAYLAALGICDGIEVLDEAGLDPSSYPASEFVGWWRAVDGSPGLAWPVAGVNYPPFAWEVAEFSDYSSRYWTDFEWRPGRAPPYALTAWQLRKAFERAALDVPTARPWLCLVTCCGPFYTKRVPGSDYQAGDTLQKGGARAADVITQVWLALAHGASGVRVYGYDWALWRDDRANSAIDTTDHQTGSRPGDERWPGVAAALASVARREGALLTTPYTPMVSGPWVFGRRGSLVWGINISERELPSPNGPGTVIAPYGESQAAMVPAGCVILWAL